MRRFCLLAAAASVTNAEDPAEKSEPEVQTAEQTMLNTILPKKQTIIGIDLGTTYSCVGVYKNGRVEIITNDQGNRITPSYVAFSENDMLVGEAAKNQITKNPYNTIFDVKRLIGRRFEESLVQEDIANFPFKVTSHADGHPVVNVKVNGEDKELSPEQISSMVLTKMKEIAENYLGEIVTEAVITVPAYFNDAQRQATKDAGTIAGLSVARILNEPTAAAIAYGLDERGARQNIIVYDLGGGTFDVSLLSIEDGVFEVVATNGDTHLGGEDFDNRLTNHFRDLFKEKTGKDPSEDARAMAKLKRQAETAKRTLSNQMSVRVEIDDLYQGEDFAETLSRAKFESLNSDLFKKTMAPLEMVLQDSKFGKNEIDEIVLVGGSTRIPKVQQMIQDFFEGKAPNRSINPDEAVAYGAAVQGGILSGQASEELLLLDVTPLTLGIELKGGVMSALISRNTVIPTKRTEVFSTTIDNQKSVEISIFEGERPLTKDNHMLGVFSLGGLTPAPRGQPNIEVTFEVDTNGIMSVEAREESSGKKEKVILGADTGRLTQEEIDKMLNDAERFKKEDRKNLELVQAKVKLEAYMKEMTFALEGESFKNMSQEDKETVKHTLDDAQQWWNEHQEAAEAKDITAKYNDIEGILTPLVLKLYSSHQSQEPSFQADTDKLNLDDFEL